MEIREVAMFSKLGVNGNSKCKKCKLEEVEEI